MYIKYERAAHPIFAPGVPDYPVLRSITSDSPACHRYDVVHEWHDMKLCKHTSPICHKTFSCHDCAAAIQREWKRGRTFMLKVAPKSLNRVLNGTVYKLGSLPYWAVFKNLSFHLVSSRNLTIVSHFPQSVVLDNRAGPKERACATLVKRITLYIHTDIWKSKKMLLISHCYNMFKNFCSTTVL